MVCEEILEPANEYRNRQNDVTERLEPARMLTWNLPNRGAVGRWKNGGLTNGRFAPKLTSVRWQIGGEQGRKKTQNPPKRGAENAAKIETWPCTERRAAKIREVETWRCRTAQAVKVRHPRTEIWWERNSRDSCVARGDVSWTMRPTDAEGFQNA